MSDDPSRGPTRAPGLTRRGFLRGAGITAAAAALETRLVQTAEAAETQAATQRLAANTLGPGAVDFTLTINGQDRKVTAEPRTTLSEVLRDTLDLTGTKTGCDRGACSACTVWMDGTPILSCMTLALDAVGHKLTTIEGLAKGDQLHPVQAAFIEHDGMQCGFCTSGMVMSCAALLEKNKNPSLDDVRAATRGNLCRCGTYPKVFESTLAAAQTIREKGA